MASVKAPLWAGEETMVQARTSLGPNGTEIHCPASKVNSAGSSTSTATSMTSAVIARTAVTRPRHSRGFIATGTGG